MTMTATRLKTIAIRGTAVCAALLLGDVALSGKPPGKTIELAPIGVYRTFLFDEGGSEIAAYDADTKRVFTVNLFNRRIDVLDIADPTAPFLTLTLDVTPYGDQPNSVATHNGIVAVAVQAGVKTDPGKVVFFDAYGAFLGSATVGALPDMVTFTPDGRHVLVANEGEPNDAYTIDPEGSVSIIDLCRRDDDGHGRRGGPWDRWDPWGVGSRDDDHDRRRDCRPNRRSGPWTDEDVTTIGFSAFNGTVLDPSVRVFGPNATAAQDFEPEYIAISDDSETAWVTLQENNALAILDIKRKRATRIVGLGFKDHSKVNRGLDPSDSDNANSIQTWPVWGMYQPDGVASFEHRGRTYLVTANEGDVREYAGLPGGSEARRVSSSAVPLDPIAFPNAAVLKGNAALGRLNVTLFNGKQAGGPNFEKLFAFGARSFSILTSSGHRVFDSGDSLEQLTAARFPANFNASNTNQTRDNRSDDKGPEPENVTIAQLFGRTYLFVCLERIGGIAVYELDDPESPTFVQYINVRDFSAGIDTPAAGDLGPEGMIVVAERDSPSRKPLLIVANEVSGTTRIFEISQVRK